MRVAPQMDKDKIIVVTLSGRGDKDVFTAAAALGRKDMSRIAATLCKELKPQIARRSCRLSQRAIPISKRRFAILQKLPAQGADLIELGVPFSDPMADGPAVQASSLRALEAGMTLHKVLDLVRRFRKQEQKTPIVLMGYYNPIHAYGTARFAKDAAEAGVDGLITVDLPPEEDDVLRAPARAQALDIVRLATPTTKRYAPAHRARRRKRISLLRLHRRRHRHEKFCRG